MNTVVTSKEEILRASRELIRTQGWGAVSIRSVAAACGVSVGSIYNYFDSKAALVGAAVESVWCEIFHRPEDESVFESTLTCVAWMYGRMEYGCKQYPGFFTLHSASFVRSERPDAKQRMEKAWDHIIRMLCSVLRKDPLIREGALDADFTPEQFADLLFSLMLAAQLRGRYDPSAALQLVERTLYGNSL